MELSTFGAVMRFAIDLERAAADFYTAAAQSVASQPVKDAFTALAEESRRRATMLERTRQEKVTEMILEPIHGLRQEDYLPQNMDAGSASGEGLVSQAMEMETKAARFYTDALEAGRRLLGEVARTFERLAREKADRRARLQVLKE